MKKIISLVMVALILFSSTLNAGYSMKKRVGNQNTKLTIFGFSQLEAKAGSGAKSDGQKSDIKFGAQRVRIGFKYQAGPVRGKLFLDFAKSHTDKGGVGMPDMVKDAFITYYHDNALAVKFGLIKMPHGMSFTIPGWNLDVVERGFDKKLALERNMGLMISGRAIGEVSGQKVNGYEMGHDRPWRGFGYDIMIANQAGRSGAVTNAKVGDANSYAARFMYDAGEIFHTEVSYGVSKYAGGLTSTNKEDYKSLNFGIDSHFGASNLKFEMFNSKNLKGIKNWDEKTYSFTATHYVTNCLELSIKHIYGKSKKENKNTKLGNTFAGINYYLATSDNKITRMGKKSKNAHRIQLNYVMTSGDTTDSKTWNGLGGYKKNVWLLQYQYKF